LKFIKEKGRLPIYSLYIKNIVRKGFIDLSAVFNDLFSHEKRDPIFRAAGFIGAVACEVGERDFMNNVAQYAKSYSEGNFQRYVPLFEGIDPVEKSAPINKDKLGRGKDKKKVLPLDSEKSNVPFDLLLQAQELKAKGKTFEEVRNHFKLTHDQMRQIFSDYSVPHDLEASFKRSDRHRDRVLSQKP